METSGHLGLASVTAAESSAAALVASGRGAHAAGRIPAVIGSDDTRDAAFEIHLGTFHAFVSHRDFHGAALDGQCLFGVQTVVVRLYACEPAAHGNVPVAVDAVVVAVHVNLAGLYDDVRVRLDALHARVGGAGVASSHHAPAASAALAAGAVAEAGLAATRRNLDRRLVGGLALGELHGVARADAVECRRDGDGAARNHHEALALGKLGGVVFVTLDAVAAGVDGDVSAVDGERGLALEAAVLCGNVQRAGALLDFEVVARVNAVVVVSLHGEASATLDAQVVLCIDGGLRGIDLVVVGVRLRTRGTVFDSVRGALHQVEFRLLGVLHVDGRVAALDGDPVQEEVHLAGIGCRGAHDYLEVGRGSLQVVVAGTRDGNGLVALREAAVVVRDGRVGAVKGDGRLGTVERNRVVVFGVGAAAANAGIDGARTAADDASAAGTRGDDRAAGAYAECSAAGKYCTRPGEGSAERVRACRRLARQCAAGTSDDAAVRRYDATVRICDAAVCELVSLGGGSRGVAAAGDE